jgi:hypothetical protein
MEEKLKVSDLINLSQEDYLNTNGILSNLLALSKEYHDMTDMYDPNQLEIIKRKFDSQMQHLSPYYAKIKKYKGTQHVYLDEVRKKIKGEALQLLLDEGHKVTSAETLVYKTDYYVQRINLMEDIKEFMIRTELLYERFEATFNSIIQSLSTAKKEYEASKR